MPPCGIDLEPCHTFKQLLKRLQRKYRNIIADVEEALGEIEKAYTTACHADRIRGVGAEVWKYRQRCSDMQKGKRGGIRLIAYRNSSTNTLYPILVYVKAEDEDVPAKEVIAEIKALRAALETKEK